MPIHCDDKLRNTRKIAQAFRPFASGHFTPRGSMEDALGVAGDCVDALSKEGWANNRTALLTTKDRHPIHLDYYEHEATKEYWQESHAKEAEFYTHMLGFKGLERSLVVL